MPFAGIGFSAANERAHGGVAGALAAAFEAAQQCLVHGVVGFQRHGVFNVHRHEHERNPIARSIHGAQHGHFHVHFLRYHAQLCGRAVTVGDVEYRAVCDIVCAAQITVHRHIHVPE